MDNVLGIPESSKKRLTNFYAWYFSLTEALQAGKYVEVDCEQIKTQGMGKK